MTQNSTIEISDVKKLFDELMPWEQKECAIELSKKVVDSFDDNDIYKITGEWPTRTVEEAIEQFGARELLESMDYYDINDFIEDDWNDPLNPDTKLKLFVNEFRSITKGEAYDIAMWFKALSQEDKDKLMEQINELQ